MLKAINKPGNVGARSTHGFTVVEVMLVMAMIGIFAAIAYPSYQSAVRKAKRTEGRAALMQIMQQQERYYSQNTSYLEFSSSSSGENEKLFKWYSADTPKNSAYEIGASACPDQTIQTCVKLTAKPGTNQVNSSYTDPECGNLTLTSTGVKAADAKNCW